MDIPKIYIVTTYVYTKVNFKLSDFANFDGPEKKNANTGQASAKVYFIGPQYETDIPVKNKNNNSTTLSTNIYNVARVRTYVKNVFTLT